MSEMKPDDVEACCADDGCKTNANVAADPNQSMTARRVRMLSWFSLAWMTLEGAVGLIAGVSSGSIALVGWALGSVIEGLASVIVIWRFTGSRSASETSEATAQRAVAISFFLLAPYILVESVRNLLGGAESSVSVIGVVVTGLSVLVMPLLGLIKRRLGAQLSSGATQGEGTQNLLCAAQGAAVLISLGLNAAFGLSWVDPVVGIALAVVAVREGREAWQGERCC